MNRLFIIGNLTKAPELRTTPGGVSVCTFNVAVNRRQKGKDGQNEADFFRVSAWRELAENCAKYLEKGKKVAIVGSVSMSTFTAQDGKQYSNMEVNAVDVEFLTPKSQLAEEQQAPVIDKETGMEKVDVKDELPF